MIVYNATKKEFNKDVILNQIADKVLALVKEKNINAGGDNEYRSWQNSLSFMRNVIDDDEDLYENRRSGRRLSEDKIPNYFGKHPAWRKQPMTTPPNKEVAINGAREWDDESAQGEEPYAKQIGDGSPFNEIVNEVTNAILKKFYGNKKKV